MLTRAQGKCHRLWPSQAHTIYLAGLFSNVLPGPVCGRKAKSAKAGFLLFPFLAG